MIDQHIAQEIEHLQATITNLRANGSPGVLHRVDQAFYDLAVKQRNYERFRNARLLNAAAMAPELLRRLENLRQECENVGAMQRPGNPYEWCARELRRLQMAAVPDPADEANETYAADQVYAAQRAAVLALHPKIESPRHGCCAAPQVCKGHRPECWSTEHGLSKPTYPCKTLQALGVTE